MLRIENRKSNFEPAVEVALHPIGRSEPITALAAIVEIENPRVLEIAIDDGNHAYPFRDSGQAGAQAAHAAYEQIDLHASLARQIEFLDQSGIDQTVYLGDDARGLTGARLFSFFSDMCEEMFSQCDRRQY